MKTDYCARPPQIADDALGRHTLVRARIDFGRRVVGSILLHKLRQALRPELWMI